MSNLDEKGKSEIIELAKRVGAHRKKGSAAWILPPGGLERFAGIIIDSIEMLQKKEQVRSLVTTGYDAHGFVVTRGHKITDTPAEDFRLMDKFLLLEEACRLKGVPIPPTQVGSLYVTSTPMAGAIVQDLQPGAEKIAIADMEMIVTRKGEPLP